MNRSPKKAATSSTIGGTLQRRAYEYVKKQIMSRTYKPGQYLTDTQISTELSISRTPVRDALRRLKHEGFLTSQTGKGWKVYSLSLEDIHEIFDIKVELEGLLARKAAECIDRQKRAALKRAIAQMKDAAERNRHEQWRTADMELHRTIFSMAANERASRIINDLNDQWYRVRIGLVAMEGRIQRSNREHEAFVDRILSGDGALAEKFMRLHLNNLRQELVNVLVNLVLPFAQNGV